MALKPHQCSNKDEKKLILKYFWKGSRSTKILRGLYKPRYDRTIIDFSTYSCHVGTIIFNDYIVTVCQCYMHKVNVCTDKICEFFLWLQVRLLS